MPCIYAVYQLLLHWHAETTLTYDDGIIDEDDREREYEVIEAVLKDPVQAALVEFRPASRTLNGLVVRASACQAEVVGSNPTLQIF